MKEVIKRLTKDKKEKTDSIQSGTIIALVNQSMACDYYDIRVNGTYYSNVPCPLPQNIQDQLKLEQPKGIQITQNRKILLQRKPMFSANESVQVIFEGGNKNTIKISLENSIVKFEETEIVYI